MSYVDMVEDVVHGLLRDSRYGYWELHLHIVTTMIQWCFAYNTRSQAAARIADRTA